VAAARGHALPLPLRKGRAPVEAAFAVRADHGYEPPAVVWVRLGSYPIGTAPCSSTTIYQISDHIQ
jgi:hypothetical protein